MRYRPLPALQRIIFLGPWNSLFCSSYSQATDRTLQEAMLGFTIGHDISVVIQFYNSFLSVNPDKGPVKIDSALQGATLDKATSCSCYKTATLTRLLRGSDRISGVSRFIMFLIYRSFPLIK
jgi:hypothetical protein